jgi:hypothetical protein
MPYIHTYCIGIVYLHIRYVLHEPFMIPFYILSGCTVQIKVLSCQKSEGAVDEIPRVLTFAHIKDQITLH